MRAFIGLLAIAAFMLAMTLGLSTASAQVPDPTVTGTASCIEEDGSFSIDWTVMNNRNLGNVNIVNEDQPTLTNPAGDTELVDGEVEPDPFNGTEAIGPQGVIGATTTYGPGDSPTFPITLIVYVVESSEPFSEDDSPGVGQAAVGQPEDCPVEDPEADCGNTPLTADRVAEGIACISVTKDTDPEDDDGNDFRFDLSGPGNPTVTLEDNDTYTWTVSPGSYTLEELADDEWEVNDISCSGLNVNDIHTDVDDQSVLLEDVEAGDDVDCDFNNIPIVEEVEPTPTATTPPTLTEISCEGTTLVTTVNGVVTNLDANHPNCVTATVAPSAPITPPSTGDAGLKGSSASFSPSLMGGGIAVAFLVGAGLFASRRRLEA